MTPLEIVFFAVSLFLALAFLISWKRRRDVVHARLNKGLRGYVEGGAKPVEEEDEEMQSEELQVA